MAIDIRTERGAAAPRGGLLRLRTGAWYGDREIRLDLPAGWRVRLHAPAPLPPLDDEAIAARLDHPLGRPGLAELAEGCRRPLVIVDDPNRPTPVDRILPFLLARLRQSGVSPDSVTLLVAPGSHGLPRPELLARKLGPAAAGCRVLVHDCEGPQVGLGRTSQGTPVLANPALLECDLVVGVGGVYPNQTAGFGGGTKLALGVLGIDSIAALHHGHRPAGWGRDGLDASFRRDLDEIAAKIGLRWVVSALVNAERELAELRCGDPMHCQEELVGRALEAFSAPGPGAADLVVANAYPNDLSLTFVGMKGLAPLARAARGASRVAVAACPEGVGRHRLFPLLGPSAVSPAARARALARHPGLAASKLVGRARRLARPSGFAHPVRVFRSLPGAPLPRELAGMRIHRSWSEVLDAVRAEQGRDDLEVAVYPCAALQALG
jgi:hypothetical protein